jgi:alanine racemase
MFMLDVTGCNAKTGDTVTIFGENPTALEIAQKLGTITYEVFTSVPARIIRKITE